MEALDLAALITDTIHKVVAQAGARTQYRPPLVGFAAADDPRFRDLQQVVHPTHMLPADLLPGARSVVSYFLPFSPLVVEANGREREQVAREWALAYVETNQLIGRVSAQLNQTLAAHGIQAAAEPATHNFDPESLVSRWSHKSVAVVAGLGSLGLHQMVITDAGCAGRFGSLLLDAGLPASQYPARERCAFYHDGSCLECVTRCPVSAIDPAQPLDKQSCWTRCLENAQGFEDIGLADVCGKCAIGPCACESAV